MLLRWLATVQNTLPLLLLYVLVGAVVGYVLASVIEHTVLLDELWILAHEQRRMAIAAAQRELAKEPRSDA